MRTVCARDCYILCRTVKDIKLLSEFTIVSLNNAILAVFYDRVDCVIYWNPHVHSVKSSPAELGKLTCLN